MDANNLALIRGVVTREPRVRELPSGTTVTTIEVTTHSETLTTSVPVVVHDQPIDVAAGDDVVVVGAVQRRFFRAGGLTQSRTEVVAEQVVRARRRRTVERALADVAAAVARPGDPAR